MPHLCVTRVFNNIGFLEELQKDTELVQTNSIKAATKPTSVCFGILFFY